MEHKTHNYVSMILEEETFNEFGYSAKELTKSSGKFIVAICRFCGQKAKIRKCFYTKAGDSACHKECRIQEQKTFSPFKSKETMTKAHNKLNVKYGSGRQEIIKKIANARCGITKSITSCIAKINDFINSFGLETTLAKNEIIVSGHNLVIIVNDWYHSSEAKLEHKKARNKQLSITSEYNDNHIRTFHIFIGQWEAREKQILNFIRTIIGKNTISIQARKCIVTNAEAKDFIEANHLQDSKSLRVIKYFNLEYNGEIVGSITASRHHRQNVNANDVVLGRLCFKDNCNVIGGSSKLFDKMVSWAKENGYAKIVSWSDNCWTEGNIYKVLGFELEREYGPDYFYFNIKDKSYCSKQSQQKRITKCPPEITEAKWAESNGLYRVWDCGKKKWVYPL